MKKILSLFGLISVSFVALGAIIPFLFFGFLPQIMASIRTPQAFLYSVYFDIIVFTLVIGLLLGSIIFGIVGLFKDKKKVLAIVGITLGSLILLLLYAGFVVSILILINDLTGGNWN